MRSDECSSPGKKRYATREQARNALRKLWRTPSPQSHYPIRSYPCRGCGGWHLTSKPWNGDLKKGKKQ